MKRSDAQAKIRIESISRRLVNTKGLKVQIILGFGETTRSLVRQRYGV